MEDREIQVVFIGLGDVGSTVMHHITREHMIDYRIHHELSFETISFHGISDRIGAIPFVINRIDLIAPIIFVRRKFINCSMEIPMKRSIGKVSKPFQSQFLKNIFRVHHKKPCV